MKCFHIKVEDSCPHAEGSRHALVPDDSWGSSPMAWRIMKPSFPLGRTVATPGAIALGFDLNRYLFRHQCGDCGDLCDEDKQANEEALVNGGRILSSYRLPGGRKFLVITGSVLPRPASCSVMNTEIHTQTP